MPDTGAPAAVPGAAAGVCPYTISFMHAAEQLTTATAMVFTTLCDQMRRTAEVAAKNSNVPVFLFNLPATCSSTTARDLYVHELRRLGRFLVDIGGKLPGPDELARVMTQYATQRRRLRDARIRLSGREFSEAIAQFHRTGAFTPDTRTESQPRTPAADCESGVPLALVGGPMRRQDLVLFDLIENAGGQVCLDATTTGERTLPDRFDPQRLTEDPFDELVRAYFDSIPGIFRRPNNAFYDWLDAALTARNVRGIIFRNYLWCDLWRAELQRLKTRVDIPVLGLDVSDESDTIARTTTRVQAFLELLS